MLLEALQNPLVIAIVVLILLLLIAIPVVVRRRRASLEEVLPPPELGQSIDYTSLPYEEPSGWGDRFARAPLATKLLLVLVPLVLIVSVVVLALTYLRSPLSADNPTPVVPTATITKVVADVAGPAKILVRAETTLPEGSTVAAALKENGQDFLWYNPETATAQVADGRISLTMERAKSAPAVPRQGQEYTVVLTATQQGQIISSDPAMLSVPSIYLEDFYPPPPTAVAGQPTSAPTTVPTTPGAPTPAPATTVPTTPEVTATPTSTSTLTATVFNGGNIRQDPNLNGTVRGQIHAREVVKLLEKTADGRWYRVEAQEATGWVSATLLRIAPDVMRQVPTHGATPTPQLTATVFNGGNVREQPNLQGKVLDQINAGETVQLLEKTSDGAWYKITDARGITGWVSVTLLTIRADVAQNVPVSR